MNSYANNKIGIYHYLNVDSGSIVYSVLEYMLENDNKNEGFMLSLIEMLNPVAVDIQIMEIFKYFEESYEGSYTINYDHKKNAITIKYTKFMDIKAYCQYDNQTSAMLTNIILKRLYKQYYNM